MINKKGLSAVVATSLLIVVTVAAVVGFQTWFSTFSSSLYTQSEQTDSTIGTKVERVIGDSLYFNNKYDNLTITDIKVDSVSCNVSGSYNKSISSFDISGCVNSSSKTQTVTIYTDQGIFSSEFIPKEISLQNQEEEGTPNFTTEFISTWNTSIAGTSASNQIALPLQSFSSSYNFTVTGDTLVGSPIEITSYTDNILNFTAPGVHEITITGEIVGWRFNNGGDRNKLIEISQWGPLRLGDAGDYFEGANNFDYTGDDTLNLTGTTTLARAFYNADNFNGSINSWDTSNIDTFEYMFYSADNFNQPIGDWDTSSVTNMEYMFEGAPSFNQSLNSWDTSKVTNLRHMFYNADSFDQDLNSWDTSNVTDMSLLFYSANEFNGDITSWNTSKVTEMGYLFQSTSFDQDISNWDVSSVNSFSRTFASTQFNQNISGWNVSSAQDLSFMFGSNSQFNQNLNGWDTSNVTSMEGVFWQTPNFNYPLDNWNTSKVTNMNYLFNSGSNFNYDISMWDVSNVTTMISTFRGLNNFNQNLTSWNVSSVTDCTDYDTDTPAWEEGNKPIFGVC